MATIQANFTSQHQPTGTHPPPQQSQETTKSKFSLQKPCHNIQISTPPRHTPQENKKANVKTFALWVGKLPTSRRYDLLPLLRSSPGGFARSWPYRTYPYTFFQMSLPEHTPVSQLRCKSSVFFPFIKTQWQNNLEARPFCTDMSDARMTKTHSNNTTA